MPPSLRPQTVVIKYPFLYDGGSDLSTGLLEESTELVVFFDVSGGVKGDFDVIPFGTLLDIVDFEIPENASNLTIVLEPSMQPDWKFCAAATLIRLCDHLMEAALHTFHCLHSLTFVFGDEAFSSATRDVIQETVRIAMRDFDAKEALSDSDADTNPCAFDIGILLLPEFLASKRYGPVMSTDEVAEYLRISSQHQHEDSGSDVQSVIARAKQASEDHVRQMRERRRGTLTALSDDESGDDYSYDYNSYDDDDDDEFFEEDNHVLGYYGSDNPFWYEENPPWEAWDW